MIREARHLMAVDIAVAAVLSACGGGDQPTGSGSITVGGGRTTTASATGGDITSVPNRGLTPGADAWAQARADNRFRPDTSGFRPDTNGFPFPTINGQQQSLSDQS